MAAPPSFLQSLPSETDATDGDIVTFQVKVSNDPADPTVVSWWRCGESLRPIPGHRDIISHDDGWHELILSNINEDDEGEYECRAENNRGHNSSFGSLYYYREGAGTLTDVTMEGAIPEGDGRQSGLLILIDDGSQTEESGSEKSNRKSMTVSEQMQGIIEDLTQSTQGENTGSITLEKDDEDQFNSDIEDLNDDDLENDLIQNIFGMATEKTASEDTLVPEMPSPDLGGDVAISEGATGPYGPSAAAMRPHKWSSNPNHVKKRKTKDDREQKEEVIWPPEASLVTFDLPTADTITTSVELPFARGTSTEEDAVKSSGRCAGAETPFDVADITEEAVDAGSLHYSPTDGTSTEKTAAGSVSKPVAFQEASQTHVDSRAASGLDRDSSLTSVTDISGAVIPSEGCQQSSNRMSFVKSSVKSSSYQHTDDGVLSTATSSRVSSTTMDTSSVAVHHRSSKLTRTAGEREEDESLSVSYSAKKSKVSSAYEADESSNRSAVYSESYITEMPAEHKVSGIESDYREEKSFVAKFSLLKTLSVDVCKHDCPETLRPTCMKFGTVTLRDTLRNF